MEDRVDLAPRDRSLESLGVDAASRTRILKLERPAGRKAGVRVKSVDELIAKLRTEAKVL